MSEEASEYATLVPPDEAQRKSPLSNTPPLSSTFPLSSKTITGFRAQIDEGAITIRKSTPTNCLPGGLKVALAEVARRFGKVSVQSTHRTPNRNRRAGGARRSLHLECRAIDFRVRGRGRDVMAFLRTHQSVGGLKMYRNGIIHIDNGKRRSW